MVMVYISEPLAQKLTQIAERDHQSLDEVVETLLEQQVADVDPVAPLGTLAALIQAADEANLQSTADDTSERSREILNTDYVEYLSRKNGLDEK
jgi:hypothetical protein